jgi:O-antigen biosynthesis protein WbqP
MKRGLDLLIALIAGIFAAIPCALIAIAVRIEDRGPAIYWSRRIGRNGQTFLMPKFRSMKISTPELATDRLEAPERWVTSVGRVLRRTSLDELPQLWSVIRGDMSIVGPRPALHNQHELIETRRLRGIDVLRPGITGWAQINGRDGIPEARKIELDAEYLASQSLELDLRILVLTVVRVLRSDGVSH